MLLAEKVKQKSLCHMFQHIWNVEMAKLHQISPKSVCNEYLFNFIKHQTHSTITCHAHICLLINSIQIHSINVVRMWKQFNVCFPLESRNHHTKPFSNECLCYCYDGWLLLVCLFVYWFLIAWIVWCFSWEAKKSARTIDLL